MAASTNNPLNQSLKEQVELEQTKSFSSFEDLLGNAENVFKAFLFLKKMFSSSPVFNRILKIDKINASNPTPISIESETNVVIVKNLSESEISVIIDKNDPFILFQYEQFDIPYHSGMNIFVKGLANIVQIKYEIS